MSATKENNTKIYERRELQFFTTAEKIGSFVCNCVKLEILKPATLLTF